MRNHLPLVLLTFCALAFSGCAARIGTSPKGLELPIEKAAIQLSRQVMEGGYQLITAEELAKRLENGQEMTVIDTMPPASFQKARIAGAVNCPAPKQERDLTPAVKDALLHAAGPEKGRTLVVYCGFVACGRSHVGAKVLVENGYSDVYRFPAGIVGWQEGGFPLAK